MRPSRAADSIGNDAEVRGGIGLEGIDAACGERIAQTGREGLAGDQRLLQAGDIDLQLIGFSSRIFRNDGVPT